MNDPRGNNQSAALGVDTSEQRRQGRHAHDTRQTRQFVTDAARLLADLHCHDVVIFDLRELSDVTDYVVIGSGTSDRQIHSVSQDVEQLARQSDLERFGREVDGAATWLVLDFVDVVVHLFEPNTRAHYDIEMMWDDAPRVDWQRK
jgi:ribosome-associated protein